MRAKNEVTVDRMEFKRAVAWTRRGKATVKDLRDVQTTIRETTPRIRSSLRGAAETDGGAGISNSESRMGATERLAAANDNFEVWNSERLSGATRSRVVGLDKRNEG